VKPLRVIEEENNLGGWLSKRPLIFEGRVGERHMNRA